MPRIGRFILNAIFDSCDIKFVAKAPTQIWDIEKGMSYYWGC